MVALLDRRLARRLILTPLTGLIGVVGLVLSPLILTTAGATDLIAKRRRWPRLRLAALLLGAVVIEVVALVVSLLLWIFTGFGFFGSRRWRWHAHRKFMGLYTNAMLSLIVRVLGTKIDWRDHAELSAGPVVVAARHTSFFDALVPSTVLSHRNKLLAHHVVTHGLRYAPCIDVVGHRFPNRFIKRTPGEGSSELVPIQAIGAQLDSRSAAVIFPEGTFRSPERFARTVRRLRRRQPDLAARAESLKHVLPPRANGILALLDGAPTADLVVCTTTGFEPFGSIRAIVDRPFSDQPIIVETWRIARSEIPTDPDAFGEWLFEQYVTIDAWVTTHRADSVDAAG